MKTQSLIRSVNRLGPALLLALVWVAPSTFGQPRSLKLQGRAPYYVVTDIGAPPDFDVLQHVRINNRSDILGKGDASTGPYADNPHAIFYHHGRFLDLHLLSPLAANVNSSLPVDLNDRGQVLFRMQGTGSGDTYYLYHNGRLQDFSELAGRQARPLAINSAGQIVGGSGPDENAGEAFLYSHGEMRLLGKLPGYPASTATRISDSGHILGLAMDDEEEKYQAVLFTTRGVVALGLPGHAMSFGMDINRCGDVAGISYTYSYYDQAGFSWLWQRGRFIPLPFEPAALNDDGQVVGQAGQWPHQAYLYSGGTTYNLNELIEPNSGWLLLEANDINERGQIVGWGRFNNTYRGFLLTPKR